MGSITSILDQSNMNCDRNIELICCMQLKAVQLKATIAMWDKGTKRS